MKFANTNEYSDLRYFSEDGQVVVDAENVTEQDLENVVDEASEQVAEETGSRAYSELFRANFEQRIFSQIEEAEANGGGEVDLDEAAADAINDTEEDLQDETVAQSAMEYDYQLLRMFSEEGEDEDDDEETITEEEIDEIREQAYLEGMDAGVRYYSESANEFVEGVVMQSALASDYMDTWMRVFAEVKEDGGSDEEAAAEATETASLESGIAEPQTEEDEALEDEVKVQSFVESNPYLSAFVRAFSEVKEEGGSDEEAALAGAAEVANEAGVDTELVDETVSQSDLIDYTGEDLEDYDRYAELSASETLEEQLENEEEAETKLQSLVTELSSTSKGETGMDRIAGLL